MVIWWFDNINICGFELLTHTLNGLNMYWLYFGFDDIFNDGDYL